MPALVQAYSVHQTGIIWQGRYGLFLYLGITIVAAWLLSRDAPTVDALAVRASWVVGSLVALFGVIAFLLVMVRYVIAKAPLGEMFTAPQWQPPLGWLPLVLAYGLVSAALVVLVGGTARWIARREDALDEVDPSTAAPEAGAGVSARG